MKRSSQCGLTLPELLIALLVFAMISGAAVYALRLSVEGREQLEAADARVRELQIARLIIKEDLLTIAFRTVRDEFGNAYPAPFLGGRGISIRRPQEGEELLLAFVRRGWENPDAVSPRSTLQAVEYLRVGEDLVRRVRPYLDDARGQKRIDRVLLSGVTAASVGFFVNEVNGRLNFADAWPPPEVSNAPEAVRLTLSTERYGDIEQLFWIGDLSR